MSRTSKGGRSPGSEFWSKRAGNRGGSGPGRVAKKITLAKERTAAKKLIRKEREEE